jgi:hypothetical protein
MKTTSSLVLGTSACLLGPCLSLMFGGCAPADRHDSQTPDASIAQGQDASSVASCTHATETYFNPGPDGIAGTNDDSIDETEEIEFAQGLADPLFRSHPVTILRKDGSGHPTMLVRMTYDAHGVRQTSTQYGPGPDAIYGSPDDTIKGMNVYAADSSGRLVNDIFRNSPGPNGIWGDADDPAVGSVFFVYVGDQLEWFMHGTTPGSDGVWGTADDTFPSASHLRYDLGHLTGMVTSAAKGPDGMFGTADDIISLRLAFPCVGDRVVTNAYYDPGPDGVWGSADDRLAGRQIESGDPCESACAPVLF